MKKLENYTSASINKCDTVHGGDNRMGMKRETTYCFADAKDDGITWSTFFRCF